MAEFSKYKSHSVGRLFLHNNRVPDDGVEHSNTDIDNERTMYNYHLKKGTSDDVKKRLSEVFMINRSDKTVLGEMIVTLPKDVKKEDERDFFTSVYDFYCNDFGEKNIINAVVHKDEITPHIHIDFVPVVEKNISEFNRKIKALDQWKEEHGDKVEHLCCKDLINRKYLISMHSRLSDFVGDRLGYKTEILNGATINGNKTVLQLKAETLENQINAYEKRSQFLSEEIQKMYKLARKLGIDENDIGLLPLMEKIDDLDNQNKVLQEIIARNRCTYTRQDIDRLNSKKFVSAKGVSVNVCDGSLVNDEIPNNAVVVIELYNQRPRPSPQQKLIDADRDLYMQSVFAQNSTQKVLWRNSGTSNKQYLFVKTDNEQQTMQMIIELEQRLKEKDLRGRKLYMDRMETDKYDMARSILNTLEIDTQYYTRRDLRIKTEDKETELNRQYE